MTSTFSESNLIKKLQNVINTQDSISSLSLWILHHKSHYKQIVDQWLKCYVKAKGSHRLALFYLANDIVQHAKRKSLSHYLNEFMGALRKATKATDDPKIVPNITRVLGIWLERNIYSKEFIDELRDLIDSDNAKEREIKKLLKEYSAKDTIQMINNTCKIEENTKAKLQGLHNCKVDFANSELLNKLKDKSYGEQFSKEFDEASKCLNAIIGAFEKEVEARKELLVKLESAKSFYDYELISATSVWEAFNNCEQRVKQVKEKLYLFSSSPQKGFSSDNIASVINMIQQAQSSNSVSSLDQRLTSLMSNSGQFGLSLNNDSQAYNYDPSYQSAFAASSFESGNQIESMITARGAEPTENLEPADMDLGDSDEDDNLHMKNSKVIELSKTIAEDKLKRIPYLPTDISGLFPMIPPPPPPPMPPPVLKELFAASAGALDVDPYASMHNAAIPPLDSLSGLPPPAGNAIRNLADRSHRGSGSSYSHQNLYRNPTDNRPLNRNQNYNFSPSNNSNHGGGRWKGNNNGGDRGHWKRNSYGNHH